MQSLKDLTSSHHHGIMFASIGTLTPNKVWYKIVYCQVMNNYSTRSSMHWNSSTLCAHVLRRGRESGGGEREGDGGSRGWRREKGKREGGRGEREGRARGGR